MNRALMIPAGCCLCAFAALLAALHGATGRPAAAETVSLGDLSGRSLLEPVDRIANAMTAAQAEQKLTALSGEYLRPWRQWENSPRRLYSRVAPRPIPSISAEVAMSSEETGQSDSFLLASIAIRKGRESQSVPCVVDRTTQQVRFFHAGQWLNEADWLQNAPLP